MVEATLSSIVELYRGLGPSFVAAFLAVLTVFIYFNVRWADEHRRLRTEERDFRRVLAAIEHPNGALAELLRRRVDAPVAVGDPLAEPVAFRAWLSQSDLVTSPRADGEVLVAFLHGVLTSPRPLSPTDNRINLTAARNRLKGHRYHRVINVTLASSAVSLGLLGTVAGLWLAFKQADFSDVANLGAGLGQVMNGLARALYTTAVGIIISVPMAVVSLRMEDQLEQVYGQLEELREAVIATLTHFCGEA